MVRSRVADFWDTSLWQLAYGNVFHSCSTLLNCPNFHWNCDQLILIEFSTGSNSDWLLKKPTAVFLFIKNLHLNQYPLVSNIARKSHDYRCFLISKPPFKVDFPRIFPLVFLFKTSISPVFRWESPGNPLGIPWESRGHVAPCHPLGVACLWCAFAECGSEAGDLEVCLNHWWTIMCLIQTSLYTYIVIYIYTCIQLIMYIHILSNLHLRCILYHSADLRFRNWIVTQRALNL